MFRLAEYLVWEMLGLRPGLLNLSVLSSAFEARSIALIIVEALYYEGPLVLT